MREAGLLAELEPGQACLGAGGYRAHGLRGVQPTPAALSRQTGSPPVPVSHWLSLPLSREPQTPE